MLTGAATGAAIGTAIGAAIGTAMGAAGAGAEGVVSAEAGVPPASVADAAFAEAVSHTSLIAAVVLAVGTVVVAALLPSRRDTTHASEEEGVKEEIAVG